MSSTERIEETKGSQNDGHHVPLWRWSEPCPKSLLETSFGNSRLAVCIFDIATFVSLPKEALKKSMSNSFELSIVTSSANSLGANVVSTSLGAWKWLWRYGACPENGRLECLCWLDRNRWAGAGLSKGICEWIRSWEPSARNRLKCGFLVGGRYWITSSRLIGAMPRERYRRNASE